MFPSGIYMYPRFGKYQYLGATFILVMSGKSYRSYNSQNCDRALINPAKPWKLRT